MTTKHLAAAESKNLQMQQENQLLVLHNSSLVKTNCGKND